MSEEELKKPVENFWRLRELAPQLSTEAQGLLFLYFKELVKFNKVVNLVSSKTLINADLTHFIDSVLFSEIVSKKINKNIELYDIGSGNGFPGLVYSCLNREQKVVLVDSDQRKCEFLKHTADRLGLKNTQVLNVKGEELKGSSVEQAMCRGFAPLQKAMFFFRKLVPIGGSVYYLKSDEWAAEFSKVPTQMFSVWETQVEADYTLPIVGAKYFVVRTDKIS